MELDLFGLAESFEQLSCHDKMMGI